MTEVQQVIRTTTGDVLAGEWESFDGGHSLDDLYAGLSGMLGRGDASIALPTEDGVVFIRVAAIESVRIRTREAADDLP